METFLGILIPFVGTSLGATMVFFMKNTLNNKIEKLLMGFAAGVMIAASIWSLIIPAIEMSENQGIISWLPSAIGFTCGIVFLLIMDYVIPQPDNLNESEKSKSKSLLFLAVTLHNIPEGMAVGVIFAGVLAGSAGITLAGAFSLAIGIAIQNFPEGAIISMPLKSQGITKKKAFVYGVLSGIVEPIGAFITILLTNIVVPILPYLLAFAAGTMIYVVVEELIPEERQGEKSKLGIVGLTIGFLIMMILDVTLG